MPFQVTCILISSICWQIQLSIQAVLCLLGFLLVIFDLLLEFAIPYLKHEPALLIADLKFFLAPDRLLSPSVPLIADATFHYRPWLFKQVRWNIRLRQAFSWLRDWFQRLHLEVTTGHHPGICLLFELINIRLSWCPLEEITVVLIIDRCYWMAIISHSMNPLPILTIRRLEQSSWIKIVCRCLIISLQKWAWHSVHWR